MESTKRKKKPRSYRTDDVFTYVRTIAEREEALTESYVGVGLSGKNRSRRKQSESFFQDHFQVFKSEYIVGRNVTIAVAQHAINLVVNFILRNILNFVT